MIKNFLFIGIAICFIISCNGTHQKGSDNQTLSGREEIKLNQYEVAGEKLYQMNCVNCHKEDGQGLARLIPPLANADYFAEDSSKLICLMKFGLEGSIVVNGIEYNQPMPANMNLTNLELAEISAYVYKTFQGQEKLILPGTVGKILSECKEE